MKISKVFEGAPDVNVESIMTDSRKKQDKAIFFCIKGMVNDGHDFVAQAINNGAVCIVHSHELPEYKKGIAYLQVSDTLTALNTFADIFYGQPTKKMKVYAVTGTNGKSTIAWVTKYLVNNFHKCGYVGTIGMVYEDQLLDSPLTTPDTVFLHKACKIMLDAGCEAVSMEVSSIGLEERRVDTIDFDVVSFTNLTHDHLDYHGNYENYFAAKAKLFQLIGDDKKAVINIDDPYGERLTHMSKGKVVTYGVHNRADYQAVDVVLATNYSEFNILYRGEKYHVHTNLVAEFNVYNLLCCLAVLHEDGYAFEDLLPLTDHIPQVLGRMEVINEGQDFNVIVDYAHTPDGFEKVFAYGKAITSPDKRIIVVFGSAGARDTRKRPELGRIADRYCKMIVLTSEDPRHESPQEIANQIKAGVTNNVCLFVEDRYSAIRHAIEIANPGDTVLILGKGDEDYMEIKGQEVNWMGDQKAASEILKDLFAEQED